MPDSDASDRASPHIAILGGFGYGNTGNDATLAVTLSALRRALPQARFTVIAPAPDVVAARHDVEVVSDRPEAAPGALPGLLGKVARELDRRAQARALMRDVDCLIVPGTGVFDDFNASSFAAAYPLLRWCAAARAAGASVKFVSIGAGPAERALSRRLFAMAARMADHRSYRDEASKAFVRDGLGLDVSRDALTPDLVFGLGVPAPAPSPEARAIAIGAMNYHTWRGAQGGPDDVYEPYMAKLSAFAIELAREGRALRIITADPGDAPATADLLARVRAGAPGADVGAPPIETLADVCAAVASADAVVASRYHTLVAAMLCARPAVSIGYAAKNREMLRDFGFDRFCQNIADFDPGLLRAHFAEAISDISAKSAAIAAVRDRLRGEVGAHLGRVAAEIAPR